ncbi:2-dehydropantoate 2-reductase [Phocoenobacter uteri]|uniref:2-dehydropantoate 2-reductase n=1 Tax=Phocoenobacter uteri TaxID=146806 RepID=A0A379CCR1_9PAST|nr:2-dehydropantoate 2-reductase [Phocoenobacter uteri]MDG6881419.1 2-dehydropantoate 2-reductase [Phocoenobacter uteri]SUB59447.1 2-dehydropantoate 2-reductase [Phocoenobacter uteri]
MKIVIAGAGAMGGRFGYMLKQAGQQVILVDSWKEHIDIISQNGLTVESDGKRESVPFTAYHTKQIAHLEIADTIILFVKAMQLPEMLSDLQSIIGQNTRVICLLNGLGHIDTIKKYVSHKNIFIGVTMWTAGLVSAGHIHLAGDGSIELQNITPSENESGQQLVDIFNEAGLKARYSHDVLVSIWKKACVNGVLNGICAILDCNLYQFGQIPSHHDFVAQVVSEFAAIAKSIDNVDIDQTAVIKLIESTYDPEKQGMHYPSMHQDLVKNHRLTEVDYINGYIARKGKEQGIPVPYCELITLLVHGKEKVLGII